jgi:hypothetical protein
MKQFVEGIAPLLTSKYPPVEEVVICVRHEADRDDLVEALPELA